MSWKFWGTVGLVVVLGLGAAGNKSEEKQADKVRDSSATSPNNQSDPEIEAAPKGSDPTPTAAMLFITDQKDGDSWVASDGKEYRLGLVNTPERNETCGADAAKYTETFLEDGFTTDSYSTDTYGRVVAEVFAADGRSLNVALAKSGLANDRYLDQFRPENPELAQRVEKAFAGAPTPECQKAARAALLAENPPPKKKPSPKAPAKKNCMVGYSPCLPVVADLNCPEIGGPVTVTGDDPYRLDRDGDGIGCD